MNIDSISVELRMSTKSESKVKAFADVTISLGNEGTVTLLGCSVLDGDGMSTASDGPGQKRKTDLVRCCPADWQNSPARRDSCT